MSRIAIALIVTSLVAACGSTTPKSSPAPSAGAWAVVNGKEISKDEVEKAYRRNAPAPGQPQPSEEEAYTAKLNLLNDLLIFG